MINVMLIDDEELARNYLLNLIDWEHYGFNVVGAFSDAQQALNSFRKTRPELVITDIYMPGKNGLELVSEIREINKRTHVFFISAYNSFEYAKQAIHLKSDEYILKDELDADTFLRKLLEIKGVIIREEENIKYTLSSIIEALFKTSVSEDNYFDIISEDDYLKLHKRYVYVIISKRELPNFIEEVFHRNKSNDYYDESTLSKSYIEAAKACEMKIVAQFKISTMNYLMVLDNDSGIVSDQKIRYLLIKYCGEICNVLSNNDENVITYYYFHKLTVKEFSAFYSRNKGSIVEHYVRFNARIVEFNESESNIDEDTQPDISGENVISALRKADRNTIEEYFAILRNSLTKGDYITYLWYVKALIIALKNFDGSVLDSTSERKFSILEGSNEYQLDESEDMIKFLAAKVEEVLSMERSENKKVYSDSILKTINYIRENYCNAELTLKIVSNEVNLSSSWLSTKFKEEVGVGVSEYICAIRIEKAKKILETTNDMAYEVSEKVGFTSSQYFSRVFKELVGVTPNRYRQDRVK